MHISINFQINLDTSNHADSVTLDALLSSIERIKSFKAECEAPAPSQPSPQPPVETPAQTASEAPSEPATDVEAATPAKRGRKPKNELKTDPEVEVQPEPEPVVVAEPELRALSIDEVRAALQQYTAAKGVPAGIELLKKFSAGRISELAAEQYAAFVAECAA